MINTSTIAAASSARKCIDIHAHYLSDGYRAALLRHGAAGSESDGLPAPMWSVDSHLEMMSKLGIERSFLSMASPHCFFGDEGEAIELAREFNEFGAEIVDQYPDRFGLFATLPLPTVEHSLVEIDYAFDKLRAVGIKLPTNAGGIYLADDKFSPILDMLNSRRAIVVLHPVRPAVDARVPRNTPVAVVDYLVETTRAVSDMVISGMIDLYPNIRWIIPHGGALLPSLVDRLIGMTPLLQMKSSRKLPDIRATFAGLYYDVAGFAVPNQLLGLLQMTGVDHILYGSDYPYAFTSFIEGEKAKLASTEILTAEQKRKIFAENAEQLLNNRLNEELLY